MQEISCCTTNGCDYACGYGLLDVRAICNQSHEHSYRRQCTKLPHDANPVFADNCSRFLLVSMHLCAFGHGKYAFGGAGMHSFVPGKIFRRRKGPNVKTTDSLNQPHNLLRFAGFDQRLELFD